MLTVIVFLDICPAFDGVDQCASLKCFTWGVDVGHRKIISSFFRIETPAGFQHPSSYQVEYSKTTIHTNFYQTLIKMFHRTQHLVFKTSELKSYQFIDGWHCTSRSTCAYWSEVSRHGMYFAPTKCKVLFFKTGRRLSALILLVNSLRYSMAPSTSRA